MHQPYPDFWPFSSLRAFFAHFDCAPLVCASYDEVSWVGAYKPRIRHTTGRVADGWLPILAYLPGGVDDLEKMNKYIDEGAASEGRDPSRIRRLLNISGKFVRSG
jgi:alkanesulfonate monooxygenase SsuD/methylene tetrahydromethanopterin reductase-like flavin-dependent oxidoreductase (luciferase family)